MRSILPKSRRRIVIVTAAATALAAVSAIPAVAAAPKPVVKSVSPAVGPTAGGKTLIVRGSGFTKVRRVVLGKVRARNVRVVSSRQLKIVVPAGRAGAVDLRVTTKRGTSRKSRRDHYTYVAPPAVASVTPRAAMTRGGTVVAIRASGATGITRVLFGATAAPRFTVRGNIVSATAPAHVAAAVSVRLVGRYGTSAAQRTSAFSFVGPPTTPPGSATATAAGPSTVRLKWTDPADPSYLHVLIRRRAGESAPSTPSDGVAVADVARGRQTFLDTDLRSGGVFSYALFGYTSAHEYTSAAHARVAFPAWSAAALPHEGDGPGGGSLASVQCFSDDTCVASGSSKGADNEPDVGGPFQTSPLVSTRTNGVWRTTVLPLPPRTSAAGAGHVTCSDPTHCGAIVGLNSVAVLNGGRWTLTQPGKPDQSDSPGPLELVDLACPAPGRCYALGSYAVADDGKRWVIDTLRDGAWTTTKLQLPSTSNWAPRVTDLSCANVTHCLASGYAVSPFAPATGYPFVVESTDNSWVAHPVTPPADSTRSTLVRTVCTQDACSAWGESVTDDAYHPELLGVRKIGTTWTAQSIAPPDEGRLRVETIACPAAPVDGCSFVGDMRATSGLALWTYAGGVWRASGTLMGSRLPAAYVPDLSCARSQACVAVGEDATGESSTPMAIDITPGSSGGGVATRVPGENPLAPLGHVSCGAPGHCVATGNASSYKNVANYIDPVLEVLDGSTWRSEALPLPAEAHPAEGQVGVGPVSCATATFCVVFGSWSSVPPGPAAGGDDGTFVDVFDGQSFRPESMDDFTIFDLDCRSAGHCVAVGQRPDGTPAAARLANGKWTITRLIDPAGADDVHFGAISCADDEHCTAVGMGDLNSDTVGKHMIVETLADNVWTASTIAATARYGNSETLTDVSCPTASACTLAAAARDEDDDTFDEVFTPGPNAWQAQTLPSYGHAGNDPVEPRLSCPTVSSCTIVDDYRDDTVIPSVLPIAYTLVDGQWDLRTLPAPAEAAGESVSDVTCLSPNDCTAVGLVQIHAAALPAVLHFN